MLSRAISLSVCLCLCLLCHRATLGVRAAAVDVTRIDSAAEAAADADDQPSASPSAVIGDSAIGDVDLSWQCANNASCVSAVATEVLDRLRQHRPIGLGGVRVEPLVKEAEEGEQEEARALSFMDVISDNALKIPLGPMLISVQRSRRYDDYLEVALLKKDTGVENGNKLGGLAVGVAHPRLKRTKCLSACGSICI